MAPWAAILSVTSDTPLTDVEPPTGEVETQYVVGTFGQTQGADLSVKALERVTDGQ